MERERDKLPKQQWEERKSYYTLSFWDLQLSNDASSLIKSIGNHSFLLLQSLPLLSFPPVLAPLFPQYPVFSLPALLTILPPDSEEKSGAIVYNSCHYHPVQRSV